MTIHDKWQTDWDLMVSVVQVVFIHFSVVSHGCLSVTGSSMLTFIVLSDTVL